MWEFWRSKLSKGKTRHKRRDLDTGSDDDSPSTARSLDIGEGLPGTSPENSSHGKCTCTLLTRLRYQCDQKPYDEVQFSAVYFKDIILPASDDDEEDESDAQSETASRRISLEGASRRASNEGPRPSLEPVKSLRTQKSKRLHRVDRQKLIIILVGLPGRGKTFLCNKLMCYLNW